MKNTIYFRHVICSSYNYSHFFLHIEHIYCLRRENMRVHAFFSPDAAVEFSGVSAIEVPSHFESSVSPIVISISSTDGVASVPIGSFSGDTDGGTVSARSASKSISVADASSENRTRLELFEPATGGGTTLGRVLLLMMEMLEDNLEKDGTVKVQVKLWAQ